MVGEWVRSKDIRNESTSVVEVERIAPGGSAGLDVHLTPSSILSPSYQPPSAFHDKLRLVWPQRRIVGRVGLDRRPARYCHASNPLAER